MDNSACIVRPQRLLFESLHASASEMPDKTVILAGGSTMTYGALHSAVLALAKALVIRGVKRGDRVGIFMENSIGRKIIYIEVYPTNYQK